MIALLLGFGCAIGPSTYDAHVFFGEARAFGHTCEIRFVVPRPRPPVCIVQIMGKAVGAIWTWNSREVLSIPTEPGDLVHWFCQDTRP